ncbi:MAG: pseudoazurin [Pseudomonadota bacterium]
MASTAAATEHEVQMLNKGPDGQRNWFEPAIVMAEPGDTIKFLAVDKGHNAQSILVPEGSAEWKGKINEELVFTVDKPGVYAYKCTPHFGMGMIGFIVVGDPSINIEAVESMRYPGKSKALAAELIGEIKGGAES